MENNKDRGYIRNRLDRIDQRKNQIGSKHRRKLKRYSESFNRIFLFFFLSNRRGIIKFCGSHTNVVFDINGPDCKECFRLYEDGYYKNRPIITRHPNIVYSVLVGKKGWGLWLQEWADGIVEFTFTRNEILGQFDENGIEIPPPFLKDFENVLEKKKRIRNLNYLKNNPL